jgi:iron complex outermembrane receptor protein
MQRTILEAGGTYTQSVGEAHIPGVELEMSAVPVKNLELNANLGALAPRYVTFADPILGDLSHSPFLYVSKFTAGVGGTYTVPVSYGAYDFHADWGYQSARWFSQPILGAPSFALQPGVGLLNAQISLQLQSQSSLPLRLTIWGKNLTAVKYNNFVLDLYGTPVSPSVGVATAVRGDPLTFGGNVTYRFE